LPNIVHITVIKKRKMRGVRHIAFMMGKLAKAQPLGRPRQRFDDTDKMEFKAIDGRLWSTFIWPRTGASGGILWRQ
jgi:hypothetical protein